MGKDCARGVHAGLRPPLSTGVLTPGRPRFADPAKCRSVPSTHQDTKYWNALREESWFSLEDAAVAQALGFDWEALDLSAYGKAGEWWRSITF
jgi:hypothetical protein